MALQFRFRNRAARAAAVTVLVLSLSALPSAAFASSSPSNDDGAAAPGWSRVVELALEALGIDLGAGSESPDLPTSRAGRLEADSTMGPLIDPSGTEAAGRQQPPRGSHGG